MRLAIALVLAASTAHARDLVVEGNTARQPIPATGVTIAQSRIIYLNHVGATLKPGANDSRKGTSTLVQGPVTIAAWNPGGSTWADTASCFRAIWAPFGVTVVEADPGNVPHIEAVFGGTPQQLGMGGNVAGVSPFTTDCAIVENSIVFTFAAAMPQATPRQLCEIMAQEVAHSYGLDHELLASDPMTYLSYHGDRAFQDQTASCGESTPRPCGINGSTCRANQNSVQLLLARVGSSGPDTVAPTLVFEAPADGATVSPAFEVDATASDDREIVSATLAIDGTVVATQDGPGPFAFDASVTAGDHTVTIAVSDGTNTQTASHAVRVETATGGYDELAGGCAAGDGGGLGLVLLALLRATTRRCSRANNAATSAHSVTG